MYMYTCTYPVKMNYVVAVLFSILQCVYSEGNGENDCIVSVDKGPGKCVLLSQCPSAIDALQAGIYAQPCGFIGIEPVVCCETASALTNSFTDQQCMKYSNLFPRFVIPVVVGGTDTLAKKYPHTASLGFARGNDKLWQCGGSLISDQFVLTAAHCLQSREFGHISWVRLGEQNLPAQSTLPNDYPIIEQITHPQFTAPSAYKDDALVKLDRTVNLPAQSTFPNDYQIIERIAHPQYRAPSAYNDIALVKLDRTVRFTRSIKPACLHTNSYIAPDTTVIATGWGLTKFAGQPSVRLQEVHLDLFNEQECNETYSNMAGTRKLRSGILSESQVCAGGRTVEKDTCQGDSGGPLQIYLNDTDIFSIVGVTSFGKACGLANIPGVYSRVSHYVPWIESVVWPSL